MIRGCFTLRVPALARSATLARGDVLPTDAGSFGVTGGRGVSLGSDPAIPKPTALGFLCLGGAILHSVGRRRPATRRAS